MESGPQRIKLGLALRHKPFKDGRGVIRIDGQELIVIDLVTGAEVGNLSGLLWGPGDILMAPLSGEENREDGGGLFTKKHFDPKKDYLVLVIECEHAVNL